MPVHLENETELVADARRGSADAFTTLIRQYERHIYRLALNITGNREDAEDVLQEALLKAFRNLSKFEGQSRFYTWLVRIAVNESLMKLRRRRTSKEVSLDEPAGNGDDLPVPRELQSWGENPEGRYAGVELQRILSGAIARLEPRTRAVFLLRDVEHLSIEETSGMLAISVPAVKSRLLRARLKLREYLVPFFKKEAPSAV